MLHLSESDANCSRSTKYVWKLVKDFLNSGSEVVCLPAHADFICGTFNTAVPRVRVLRVIFFVRYTDVIRSKRLSNAHFQMLVFCKGNQ